MSSIATQALVRKLSSGYVKYSRPTRPVSLQLAEQQHEAYVQALRSAGLEVGVVEPDEQKIDCVFIEDAAVLWNGCALITRMQPDREGEQPPLQDALRSKHKIMRVEAPGTLEGGDVLHMDRVTYVGLSSRTNEGGVDALRQFLGNFGRPVVAVPVEKCLHLKTAATYLGNRTLILAPTFLDFRLFDVDAIVETEPGEEAAANCLRVGKHLLIPTRCPKTEKKLRDFAKENGLAVVPLECSEFQKGEGSLTCLSLLW